MPPPSGPLPGQQVGRHGDEALGRELVGHRADPVGESEDLVDHDDDRRLVLALGIDDPDANRRAAHVDVDELAVARRRVQTRGGVVLRGRQPVTGRRRGGADGEHEADEQDEE